MTLGLSPPPADALPPMPEEDPFAPAPWAVTHPGTELPEGLTAELALEYLAYSDGSPALAAERLGLTGVDGPRQLLGLIATDEAVHARAQSIFRFMQLSKLLGALNTVENDLLSKLESMEGRDVAKLYTTMVASAEMLTKSAAAAQGAGTPGAVHNNLTLNMLRMLPPDIREAVRVLMPSEALPTDPDMELPPSAADVIEIPVERGY